MSNPDMTVTPAEALKALLGRKRTDDYRGDLIRAARESMERRKRNSEHGAAVLAALRDNVGMSWREIEEATGIPRATAHRWADPPPEYKPDPSDGEFDDESPAE